MKPVQRVLIRAIDIQKRNIETFQKTIEFEYWKISIIEKSEVPSQEQTNAAS